MNIGTKRVMSFARDIAQSPLVCNIIALSSGALISQMINIASSPILTRIYGPDSFGVQSLFITATGVLVLISCLGYQASLALPSSDEDASILADICIVSAIAASAIFAIIILANYSTFTAYFGQNNSDLLPILLPISVLIGAIVSVQTQWLARTNRFKILSTALVAGAAVQCSLKFGLWLVSPSGASLIIANIIGTCTTLIGVSLAAPRSRRKFSHARSIWHLAKEHRHFPIWRMPQDFINGISQGLPVVLLAQLFGTHVAGQYALAVGILLIPGTLLGGAVSQVLYPELARNDRDAQDLSRTIISATGWMLLIAAIPFAVIAIIGPEIFNFVFGGQWTEAGKFAALLTPFFLLQFVNKPAVAAIPVLRIQRGLFIYELMSTAMKVAALVIVYRLTTDRYDAILAFSLAGAFAYMTLIGWVIHTAKRANRENKAS